MERSGALALREERTPLEKPKASADRSSKVFAQTARKDPKNLEAANDLFDSYPQSC